MTTINQQTQRIATWLSRFTASTTDLANFSDRNLRDIGLVRQHVGIDGCKLFWMA
jgi:uncharacterized protein YjiS (DUF1127 family)